MFNIRVEFDADEDLDKEPVVIFTQFLRDSFVKGFKSDDKIIKDKFIAVFDTIKDKVPRTEEAIVNQTSRPEAHPTHRSPQEFLGVIEMPPYEGDNSIDAATPCVTTQVHSSL